MQPSLGELERDVEAARARVVADLVTLRSPQTHTQLQTDLRRDVLDAKDQLVGKAKDAASSAFTDFVDTLKAKAASNPVAVLAIAAGLGWRIFQRPPITTTLIGAGLYGLLKSRDNTAPGEDRLATAKRRLKEQAVASSDRVASTVASAGEAVGGTIKDWAKDGGEAVKGWTTEGRETANDALEAARRHLHDTQDFISEQTRSIQDKPSQSWSRQPNSSQQGFNQSEIPPASTDVRDSVLLGIAGVAVAAAIGLAYQRRS